MRGRLRRRAEDGAPLERRTFGEYMAAKNEARVEPGPSFSLLGPPLGRAEALRGFLASGPPTAPAFKVPRREYVIDLFGADLDAAGIATATMPAA